MVLVDNAQIKSAELLSSLPLYLHAYVWPFAVIWPVFARYYCTPSLYEKYISSSEWTFVWLATIVTLQSLVWLSTNWSVSLKAIVTATKAQSIDEAHKIKVIPVANAGSAEICTIIRDQVCPRYWSTSQPNLWPRHAQSLDCEFAHTYSIGQWPGKRFISLSKAPFPLRLREKFF